MRKAKEVGKLSEDVQIRVERGETITLTTKEEAFDVFYAPEEPGGCVADRYRVSLNLPLPVVADGLTFHSTVHVEYMDSNNVERTYTTDLVEASSGHNTLSLETELQIRDSYPRRDHSFGRAWLTWRTQTVTGRDDHGRAVSFRVAVGATDGVFSRNTYCNMAIKKLSAPTYEFEAIRDNFAYVHMTCCIRECGEICGVHIPSPSDEYDECSYEIQIASDIEGWKNVGPDIEELVPDTKYYVRVRTVDMPGRRCESSDWVSKVFRTLGERDTRITATSGIPLYYSDDSAGPQLVPCISRVVWDQDNQICDGRFPANECWEGDHVISSLTFPAGCGVVTRDLSEGSMYDRKYSGTVTANTYNNTLDITITQYPPAAAVTCPAGEMRFDNFDTAERVRDYIIQGELGCKGSKYCGPVDYYAFEEEWEAKAILQITECINAKYGNCMTEDEYMSCLYEVERQLLKECFGQGLARLKVKCNQRTTHFSSGRKLLEHYANANGTIGFDEWRKATYDNDPDRSTITFDECDFVTAAYAVFDGDIGKLCAAATVLTVDIPASVAAGGIPAAIKTLNDAPFTFIIRNDTTDLVAVAVFLSFRGVDTTAEYPRDITGLVEVPGGGYNPPRSSAYIWDNGYVNPALLILAPNTSKPYTLTVWLPDEAIPEGRDYASYSIHTILKKQYIPI